MEKIRLIEDASIQNVVHLVVHACESNYSHKILDYRNTYELCAKKNSTYSMQVLGLLEVDTVLCILCIVSISIRYWPNMAWRLGLGVEVSCPMVLVCVYNSEADFR